jgi:hypothetical protein
VFSTSLHFPSELGGFFTSSPNSQFCLLQAVQVTRAPWPSFLSTREIELTAKSIFKVPHNHLGAKDSRGWPQAVVRVATEAGREAPWPPS